ncbi:MAG: hypothetical protein QG565_1483 [Campylobacterota bacterium]|nr:hypothetical protein [Campylobacterota bacterium]MDQ1268515.1 hypothetical protein [Campylobacterota bacterium]
MKTVKIFLLLSVLAASVYAQTPFVLSGIKSYYPVVEINTDKIDTKYKQIILNMMIEKSNKLGIETKNFSSRSLAFLISYIGVGDTIALKMDFMLGENAIRLDTKEEIFVVSYMSSRIFVPEEIEEDLLSNAEELLDIFTAQYIEDNL